MSILLARPRRGCRQNRISSWGNVQPRFTWPWEKLPGRKHLFTPKSTASLDEATLQSKKVGPPLPPHEFFLSPFQMGLGSTPRNTQVTSVVWSAVVLTHPKSHWFVDFLCGWFQHTRTMLSADVLFKGCGPPGHGVTLKRQSCGEGHRRIETARLRELDQWFWGLSAVVPHIFSPVSNTNHWPVASPARRYPLTGLSSGVGIRGDSS